MFKMKNIKENQTSKAMNKDDKYSKETYQRLAVSKDIISMSLLMASNEKMLLDLLKTFDIKVSTESFMRIHAPQGVTEFRV